MRIEVWGTTEEYRELERKHSEFAKRICYMGKEIPIDPEVEKALARLKQDTEDMKHMKEKFVNIMDKLIKS